MLEILDIHTYYGGTYVLQGLSLEVREKTVATLLGRNGMGKTTTIRSIIGFNPPRRGAIRFKRADITKLPPFQIAQMGIGLVPQGRRIFPSLSVKENLTMAARKGTGSSAWSLGKVYELFPALKDRADLTGDVLSGGEQQMLAICRALMTAPELLLLDEPSEGLAPVIVRELSSLISQLRDDSGLSILLVEQNLQMAMEITDYVYVLSKGWQWRSLTMSTS
jgi:branched-chain amino acid transport system ATP-binding protein